MSKHFETHAWVNGKIADCDPQFPTDMHGLDGGILTVTDPQGAWFGYVQEGPTFMLMDGRIFTLQAGDYFATSRPFTLTHGRAILIRRLGADTPFVLGNDTQHQGGRLKYIDGCTDTLLIAPWKLGQPCLNLLFFPEGIDQTQHTHPSDRLGVVAAGQGRCVTPDATYELRPGMIWRIPAEGLHKFQTDPGHTMTVIAYHPDSDFGPQDEFHPMLSRTIIDGVSAADDQRAEYRTK